MSLRVGEGRQLHGVFCVLTACKDVNTDVLHYLSIADLRAG